MRRLVLALLLVCAPGFAGEWTEAARLAWYREKWIPRCEAIVRSGLAPLARRDRHFALAEVTSEAKNPGPSFPDVEATVTISVPWHGWSRAKEVRIEAWFGEHPHGWTPPTGGVCDDEEPGHCDRGLYTSIQSRFGSAGIEWPPAAPLTFMHAMRSSADQCLALAATRPWKLAPLPPKPPDPTVLPEGP